MRIVPSVLAESFEDFLHIMKEAESFTDYVQIDLMDGIFVPTLSFSPERIETLNTSLSFETHLMVEDPLAIIGRMRNPRLKKIIFHFESKVRHFDLIDAINEMGVKAGLAIKPETPIDRVSEAAGRVDTLLFLTVDPGRYGSVFRPEVLEKVREARCLFPNKNIAVDGGVSLENLNGFLEVGVDYACVGSRIFVHGNPSENYRQFMSRLHELDAGRGGR